MLIIGPYLSEEKLGPQIEARCPPTLALAWHFLNPWKNCCHLYCQSLKSLQSSYHSLGLLAFSSPPLILHQVMAIGPFWFLLCIHHACFDRQWLHFWVTPRSSCCQVLCLSVYSQFQPWMLANRQLDFKTFFLAQYWILSLKSSPRAPVSTLRCHLLVLRFPRYTIFPFAPHF